MTSLPYSMGLVLVEFQYEYTGRDGCAVSIKPNERYILLAKTNDHWWHVQKNERARPFYIPAKYVKELPAELPSPLDFADLPGPNEVSGPVLLPVAVPVPKQFASDRVNDKDTRAGDEVTIRLRSPKGHRKTEQRMSTFGVPKEFLTNDSAQQKKPLSLAAKTILLEENLSSKSRAPSFSPADPLHRPTQAIPVDTPIIPNAEVTSRGGIPKQEPLENRESPPELKKDEVDGQSTTDLVGTLPEDNENIYESILELKPDVSPIIVEIPSNVTPAPSTGAELTPSTSTAPAPNTPAPNTPAPNTPAPNTPAPNTPAPNTPAPNTPAPNTPAPNTPAPNTLAPITPAPNTLAPNTPTQVENANPNTAIYANVNEVKKTPPQPPPALSLSAASPASPEEWQVHTDKNSGKEFYYHPTTGQTTWVNPVGPVLPASAEPPQEAQPAPAPSPTPSPRLSSTSSSQGSNWEKLLDDSSGKAYFYNPYSGATTWAAPEPMSPYSPGPMHPVQKRPDEGPPPLPEEDYPTEDHEAPEAISSGFPRDIPKLSKKASIPRASVDSSAPAGWNRSMDADGKAVFTSESSTEQWLKSADQKGKPYYYLRDGSRSQWNLPTELERSNTVTLPVSPVLPKVGNGMDKEGQPVMNNWRHTMGPAQFPHSYEDNVFFPKHRRNISDISSEASSSGNSIEIPQQGSALEKAGVLNKTKLLDNGKKMRKNWSQSWTVLHDGILTFHKDPKSAPSGISSKTSQNTPEHTVELRGATVGWAPKDKSSKKYVLELKTRHGCEYLIQYDTESIVSDWHKIIQDSIRQQDRDHRPEAVEVVPTENAPPALDKDKSLVSTKTPFGVSAESSDPGRVRTKLRKFLQRRPTLQSVKEKGYIRDNVFGCHLDTLCHRENSTVPKFLEKCIRTVEMRGLDVDGIYRVSGNLAVIQKLRHKADHEENLDLEDGQWEEIHVITGALKLFLRELPEPLFPYSFFEKFIAAIQIQDYPQKVTYFRDLVRSLPLPNHDTMHLLFKHLLKVIEFGEKNRMSIQSMAIVFGPTLLRPQTESAQITVYMVYQNQIVELILNEFEHVFAHS